MVRGDEAWAWAWIQVFDDDARGDPLVEDILIEELPDPAELDDYDLEEWIGALDVTSVNPIVAEHPTLRKKFGGWVRDLAAPWMAARISPLRGPHRAGFRVSQPKSSDWRPAIVPVMAAWRAWPAISI